MEQKISLLEASQSLKATAAAFDVQILVNDDKRTRFYTGLPTYSSFMQLVEYLEPKAKSLIPWNSSQTHDQEDCAKSRRAFNNISVANQLFSVLIRLRLGLVAADVCFRFNISEATYIAICFLPGSVSYRKS